MTVRPVLHPVMSTSEPEWADAQWVGEIDERWLSELPARSRVRLASSAGFHRSRLLVRDKRVVRGFVSVDIRSGGVAAADLRRAVSALPPVAPGARVAGAPDDAASVPMSVVVCTRDRADALRDALTSVLAVADVLEVIVVDNAPSTDATARLLAEIDDPRVRYVLEPRPGLSHARNRGLLEASGDFVAFTDDDVVVDRHWIQGLASGFAGAADVDCVSGIVPSGELRTAVQGYFDGRVSWAATQERREFRLSAPPADLPMFPFSVGAFGTGANFAVRRDRALALGGFDTRLGAGARTRGGEDLDFFTRVIFSGRALVVEPSAIVWHRHRTELADARDQALGYGAGLGAWIAKVLGRPATAGAVLRRTPAAVRTLLAKSRVSTDGADAGFASLARLELLGVLLGPLALLFQRIAGDGLLPSQLARGPYRRRRSLGEILVQLVRSLRVTSLARVRVARLRARAALEPPRARVRAAAHTASVTVRDRASTATGAVRNGGSRASARLRRATSSRVDAARAVGTDIRSWVSGTSRWERVAFVAALTGLLALTMIAPAPVQAVLVAATVLLGPGATVRMWMRLPGPATAVLVPAVGLALLVLGTTTMLALDAWSPRALLLVFTLESLAGALLPTASRLAARHSVRS
jgi:GT2 family glycosyltransferase